MSSQSKLQVKYVTIPNSKLHTIAKRRQRAQKIIFSILFQSIQNLQEKYQKTKFIYLQF